MHSPQPKTLLLVRHAKSSWNHPGLSDHDRPLNQRGEHDAPMMGARLARRAKVPQRIITSTALRAARTAEAIAAELDYPHKAIVREPALYLAPASVMLELLQGFDDRHHCYLLVSHNPGITELINRLGDRPIDNLPTAGVVELRFDCAHWSELRWGSGQQTYFDYPKKQPTD